MDAYRRKAARAGRRGMTFLVAVVGCVLGVAACSTSSATNSTNAAKATGGGLTNITVGLPVVDATFISAYLGQQEGFYKQQGLNVKIVVFRGGGPLTQALVGGSVDIAISGLGGIMPAVVQGQPVKVIYGGYNETSYQWIAAPSIKSVQQAAGKNWGVTSVGSDTNYMTRYIFAKYGIKANVVTGIVSTAGAEAGFQSGALQVDAAAADNDAPLKAQGDNLIASMSQFTNSYPDHMVYARDSLITSHPDTITKFLRALSEAIAYEKSHPAATEQAIVKDTKIPSQYAAASYHSFASQQYPDGRLPSAQGMNFFWSVGLMNGEFKQRVPESKWLDPHWINTYSQWSKS